MKGKIRNVAGTEISRFGSVYIFFGTLARYHFDISPIWCEYYEPKELVYFEDEGVPKSWVENHILIPIENTNSHPYYAITHRINYQEQEFYYVFCKITISEFCLEGYLSIIKGQVRQVSSVAIFLDEVEFLFTSDLFSGENKATLLKISEFVGTQELVIDSVRYEAEVIINEKKLLTGDFHFP